MKASQSSFKTAMFLSAAFCCVTCLASPQDFIKLVEQKQQQIYKGKDPRDGRETLWEYEQAVINMIQKMPLQQQRELYEYLSPMYDDEISEKEAMQGTESDAFDALYNACSNQELKAEILSKYTPFIPNSVPNNGVYDAGDFIDDIQHSTLALAMRKSFQQRIELRKKLLALSGKAWTDEEQKYLGEKFIKLDKLGLVDSLDKIYALTSQQQQGTEVLVREFAAYVSKLPFEQQELLAACMSASMMDLMVSGDTGRIRGYEGVVLEILRKSKGAKGQRNGFAMTEYMPLSPESGLTELLKTLDANFTADVLSSNSGTRARLLMSIHKLGEKK